MIDEIDREEGVKHGVLFIPPKTKKSVKEVS